MEKIILVDGNNLLFGTENLVVSATVADSKAVKSTFWLDKLTPDDILEGSVVRDKEVKSDTYNAQLKDGTPITV